MMPPTPKEGGECPTVEQAVADDAEEAAEQLASTENNVKMRSADLFSGLGLHAWWSQSFAVPAIYCEISKDVRPILLSAMHRGLVPKAPVHKDILDLEMPEGVEFITASWPCQGNSLCGKRKGMEDERSALILRVLELTHKAQPAMLFVENVPGALGSTMRILLDDMKASYDISWCCLGACDVGLPHERSRFFCLLRRRDEAAAEMLRQAVATSEAHQFVQQPEPKRMRAATSRANTLRNAAIGNAICPASAKKAFELMARNLLDETERIPIFREQADLRPWGVCIGGKEYHTRPETFTAVNANLLFDPKAYAPPPTYKPREVLKKEDILKEPQFKCLWPTPRHASVGTCHFLTHRAMRDLGTVLRFERSTPKEDRAGVVDADWVEWLMGIPAGYTDEMRMGVENTLQLLGEGAQGSS